MKTIWLIHNAEPLPSNSSRRWRYGIISDFIEKNKGSYLRFKSNYDHFKKVPYKTNDNVKGPYCLYPTIPYKTNRSIRRIAAHKFEAISLTRKLSRHPAPHKVLISLPTIETCVAVSEWCARQSIPFVIDVRDLWPDQYLRIVPKKLHFLIKPYIKILRKKVYNVFQKAEFIIGISDEYVEWAEQFRSGKSVYKYPIYYDYSHIQICRNSFKPKKSLLINMVYVGSFSNAYDLETLCQAVLQQDNLKLHLIGDGPIFNKIKALYGNEANIKLYGWLSSNEVTSILCKMDIGVLPYFPDALMTLPNKFYEYCFHGLPVLNSLVGSTNKEIATNAIGFNYVNLDDLKNIIKNQLTLEKVHEIKANVEIYKDKIINSMNNDYQGLALKLLK